MSKTKKASTSGVIEAFENFHELENIFDDFKDETKDVYRSIQSHFKKTKLSKIEMRKIFAKFRKFQLIISKTQKHM